MVTLNSDIIAVGTRAGQFVKRYETVSALLASTDDLPVGTTVEVGRYFYDVAPSDATDHHLTRANGTKLYVQKTSGRYELRAFGAALDGVTDDTTVFVTAVSVAASENVGLYIEGSLVFNPTSIQWTTHAHHLWYVSGTLRPTTTLTVSDNFTLIGEGGAERGIFWRKRGCAIIPPSGEIDTILFTASTPKCIKNVLIENAWVALHIQDAALIHIEGCCFRATTTGKNALLIDDVFWIWIRDSSFDSTSTETDGHCIHIENLNAEGWGYTGLFFMEDCITNGRGIYAKDCRFLTIMRHNHENLLAGDYALSVTGALGVTLDRWETADPQEGALGSFDFPFTQHVVIDGFYAQVDGALPDAIQVSGDLYDSSVKCTGLRPGFQTTKGGLLFGRPAWRLFSPAIATGIGDPLPGVQTASTQGDITYTGGVAAPDGTSTAFTLENTGESADFIHRNPNVTMNAGDIIIAGVSAKGGVNAAKEMIWVQIGTTETGTYQRGDQSANYFRSNSVGLDSMAMQYLNWLPLACVNQMVTHPSAGSTFSVYLGTTLAAGRVQTLWNPWIRVLRAEDGYTFDDALRIVSATGYMRSDLPSAVTALPENHLFMTGKGLTAARPSNPAAGCQWYDTTLNKPIWYNGTNWTDAAGTTV